tara:strand:- start:758 stop:1147 length:390 start_codon:yes stop_codon:yes gene_type:complete
MTYEEKITFCKEHFGKKMEFLNQQIGRIEHGCYSRLTGLSPQGRFLSGGGGEWDFCRVIPKPQFIDWTMETAESVQLRRKSDGVKVWINYGPHSSWYHGGRNTCHVPYYILREEWETVDGRPCGTEVKS